MAEAVQPTPKWYSVLQQWWENRSATALAHDRRRLLKELTGPDGDIDGKQPDDLRYNEESKKNCCITSEHVEDSFEARNCNTIKVRSKIRNTIAQLTTKGKPIDLSWTAHT